MEGDEEEGILLECQCHRREGEEVVMFFMLGRLCDHDFVAGQPLNHHGGMRSVAHFNRRQRPEQKMLRAETNGESNDSQPKCIDSLIKN
jgi:hypothetical protein